VLQHSLDPINPVKARKGEGKDSRDKDKDKENKFLDIV
jgi:hypothetical protein